MAETHSQSPLLSVGSTPDVQHDCECMWDSVEDFGLEDGTRRDGELEAAEATDDSGGLAACSSPQKPPEDPGDGDEKCSPMDSTELDGMPAICGSDQELPALDVHNASASDWEIVSKIPMSQEE
jgi:hypothetical protein